MSEPERRINFTPAWDRGQKYGIHCVELRMALVGPDLAVDLIVYTNWHLPEVQTRLDTFDGNFPHHSCHPQPANLGYHSRVPLYFDQQQVPHCEYLGGAPCYSDGSGLAAREFFNVLVAEGDEACWTKLRGYYDARLKDVAEALDALQVQAS